MTRYPILLLLPALALGGCKAQNSPSGNQADNYAARAAELDTAANNSARDAEAKLATEDAAPSGNVAAPPDNDAAITPVDGH